RPNTAAANREVSGKSLIDRGYIAFSYRRRDKGNRNVIYVEGRRPAGRLHVQNQCLVRKSYIVDNLKVHPLRIGNAGIRDNGMETGDRADPALQADPERCRRFTRRQFRPERHSVTRTVEHYICDVETRAAKAGGPVGSQQAEGPAVLVG